MKKNYDELDNLINKTFENNEEITKLYYLADDDVVRPEFVFKGIDHLIENHEKKSRKTAGKKALKILWLVAAIFVISFAISIIMSPKDTTAIRQNVLNIFQGEGELNITNSSQFPYPIPDEVIAKIRREIDFPMKLPVIIPEGFYFMGYQVEKDWHYRVTFTDGADKQLTFSCMLIRGSFSGMVDTEDKIVETITIGKHDIQLVYNDEYVTAVWLAGNLYYTVFAHTDKEGMIEILENIK